MLLDKATYKNNIIKGLLSINWYKIAFIYLENLKSILLEEGKLILERFNFQLTNN